MRRGFSDFISAYALHSYSDGTRWVPFGAALERLRYRQQHKVWIIRLAHMASTAAESKGKAAAPDAEEDVMDVEGSGNESRNAGTKRTADEANAAEKRSKKKKKSKKKKTDGTDAESEANPDNVASTSKTHTGMDCPFHALRVCHACCQTCEFEWCAGLFSAAFVCRYLYFCS